MAERTDTERQAIFEKFTKMIQEMDAMVKLGKTYIVLCTIAGVDDEDCDKLEEMMNAVGYDDKEGDGSDATSKH